MLCIPPLVNRKLRAAVESGQIDPDKFVTMTADERDALLQQYVGKEYSQNISTRFASKFNTDLSDEAVKDIVDSLAKMNKLRAADTTPWNGKSKAWSREYVELQDRLANIANPKNEMGVVDSLKAFAKEEARKIADQEGIANKGIQTVKSTASAITSPIYKSLKASMDMSYALRQGFKVFTQSPKQWGRSMTDAFGFVKSIGSKEKMDALMREFKATYLAHPNYERLVSDGKLAFGVVEDWFPTTVAEKIPALGNIFKSFNDAFTVFSQSARFGIANDMLERFEKAAQAEGRALTKSELESIATVANSITGRGGLGRAEAISGALNKLFFSARYIRSQVDTFIMPFNTSLSTEARKEALKHSVKTFATIGAILATASFFGDVELDPLSTNFGKMKIPGTKNWIDLTAGLGQYITLFERQRQGKIKTGDGKTVKLNTGDYGSKTRTEVATTFFENKLAPAPGLINQVVGKGELYGGKKPTVGRVAKELLVPISAANIIDYLQNEETATAILMGVSDTLGAGVKTPY